MSQYIIRMDTRIAALEAAQVKHLPYATSNEIDAATVAILKLKLEAEYKQDLIDNALAHIQKAANNGSRKGGK